ncbi:hypothetical protein [Candidatus Neptunochlamydia vexilliferae]|uniref:hypothetical protein n=1 Tax=Candidatus Neptunichlamydia vexilliferae TaxID=1651774 RepID=UPI0018918A25|nr:hypothetical protein [Candidatus Neptunochlamydia vexilliferae]
MNISAIYQKCPDWKTVGAISGGLAVPIALSAAALEKASNDDGIVFYIAVISSIISAVALGYGTIKNTYTWLNSPK